MKKSAMILFLLIFLITGCTHGYERDSSKGETIQISLKEMKAMMNAKEEFVIAFTQSMCGYCQDFHAMFEKYSQNHHIKLYEVPLDEETAAPSENRMLIQTFFPGFDTTPGIFYAKDGKVVSQISNSKKLTEEVFDDWVQKYQLDEKK